MQITNNFSFLDVPHVIHANILHVYDAYIAKVTKPVASPCVLDKSHRLRQRIALKHTEDYN